MSNTAFNALVIRKKRPEGKQAFLVLEPVEGEFFLSVGTDGGEIETIRLYADDARRLAAALTPAPAEVADA